MIAKVKENQISQIKLLFTFVAIPTTIYHPEASLASDMLHWQKILFIALDQKRF